MGTQANRASSQPDGKNERQMDRQMDKKKVFLLSGGHLSCDINTGALPAVIPYLQEFYGLTYQATGNIMFAQSLISALTQPLFGLLSDKFTKPWLAPLGVLLAGLGLTLTGLCSNYYAMLAAVGVCGVGSSLFHPTAARLANQVAGSHKGMALSIFSIGGNGGFVIGPLIAAALLASFGLGGTLFFGILGVVTALSLVFGIMHMSMPQKAAQGKTEGAATRPNNWKQFNRLTVAIMTRSIVLSSVHAYLPLYWMHIYGQSKTAGAVAVTIFGLAGVLSNIAGGFISDRKGRARALHLAFLPMAPALFLFSLADSMILAWIMLLVLAFSLYFAFSTMVVLGQQFLARNIGFASGVTLGLSTAVGGISAPIIGWIGDHFGLVTSFQVMAGLAVIATVVTFFIDANANEAE